MREVPRLVEVELRQVKHVPPIHWRVDQRRDETRPEYVDRGLVSSCPRVDAEGPLTTSSGHQGGFKGGGGGGRPNGKWKLNRIILKTIKT